jgi:hypothetical protein
VRNKTAPSTGYGAITPETIDDAIDRVRGGPAGRVILEFGDHECPYSLALAAVARLRQAARVSGKCTACSFATQSALESDDLRRYAAVARAGPEEVDSSSAL